MFRHDGTRSSALNIICHLLDSDTTGIQRAFGDEHEEYIYTAAGEGLTNALRKQSRGYDEKLQSLRADMETAVKARDEEIRQEMQTELKRKGEELERIKRELESTTEKFASDKTKLESRITETETTNRQQVERLQDLQNLVSQALLQVMKPQTETARQKEEQERQARILAEERLANVLTSTDRHDKIQAVRDEMNKRLNALQDEVSRITLEKADGQGQNDSEATGIYTDGHGKDREMNRKQKERAKR
ncbi:hypothetical protein EDC04DRAFT_1236050 [Pisolithus marmoratus]|nr:hypothetical protein EDC04DRAFT_1236050 [Pisolithus marmoratus]